MAAYACTTMRAITSDPSMPASCDRATFASPLQHPALQARPPPCKQAVLHRPMSRLRNMTATQSCVERPGPCRRALPRARHGQSACLAAGDNKTECMARPGPCRKALPRTRRVRSGPALCTTPAPARWPPGAAGSSKRISHRECVLQLVNTRQELPKAYWPRLERGRAARQCRVRAAVHQAPLKRGTASSTLHQAGQPPLDPIGV